MTTFLDVVRRVFPGADKYEAEFLLWERTGFPHFWRSRTIPVDKQCEQQLRNYKRAEQLAKSAGRSLCTFCNRFAEVGQMECRRCARDLGGEP